MSAPDIDSVLRYISRIQEFVDTKCGQDKVYSSTITKLIGIRNDLSDIISQIDGIISPTVQQESKYVYIDSASLQSMIKQELNSHLKESNQFDEKKENGVKNISKSSSSKKVVSSYKRMFESVNNTDFSSDIEYNTAHFLQKWFNQKILGIQSMRKIDPSISYNVKWIPKWIRDFVIYVCKDKDNVQSTFDRLYEFLDASKVDPRYTKFVPFDVAQLGITQSRTNVTNEADELWYDLYIHLFSRLSVDEPAECCCTESLVSYAYLTDEQIKNREWVLDGSSSAARAWLTNTKLETR